ncbi:sulfotransferase domain-containing protein [Sneathiella sp.]|uniref:sulfotransferase domain-containing protein n=1 Tax=Sneathiella sp. TaxID=1964365 RepID=UPI0035660ABE
MGGIIWLASYPKSGNTWTRTFIHNLFLNPDKPVDINAISQFTLGDGEKDWYEKEGGKPFEEMAAREVAALTPKVHKAFTEAYPDSVFVKTHTAIGTVFGTPLITMDYTAGAVYIIRNPLDTVISLADHYGLDLDGGIKMLNNLKGHSPAQKGKPGGNIEVIFGSWSGHVQSWMPFSRQHLYIMRYEDMLEAPEKTFGGLAKFLGLNPSKERLAKAIKFSSFDVLRKQEEEKGFNEQSYNNEKFFRVGKAGQWKDVLSKRQVDKIVKCHYQTMKQFGYLPE